MVGHSTKAMALGLKKTGGVENHLEVAVAGFGNSLNMGGEK